MKKFFIIALLILIAGFAYFFISQEKPGTSLLSHDLNVQGPCPGPTQDIPAQFEHKNLELLPNWYACHPVEKGDLIYLHYSDQLDPVVRRVVAVPGDQFKLRRDEDQQAWNISINGVLLEDSEEEPHYFGGEAPPLLSLFEKSKKGILSPHTYLVFDDHSPGQHDSGDLGVVDSFDFLGKVTVKP